jgi:methyltransferase (TIGR00027 family)
LGGIGLADDRTTLATTACWTASVRAREHVRSDRLFSDPWAELLAGQAGAKWIAGRSEGSILPIAIRTRYFDDFLQRVARQECVRQIVLAAAGLDTRAYRLDWPAGTRIFELDQPEVFAYKEPLLIEAGVQPNCERLVVSVDMIEPWADELLSHGYQPRESSCWLLEGFLFYLPGDAIVQVLEEVISLTAAGSWMGFDVINSGMLTSDISRKWVEMQAELGAPWIGTMDDPEGFLRSRGWSVNITQAGQPDAEYGRWPYPVLPVYMPDVPHNWYATAKKTGEDN